MSVPRPMSVRTKLLASAALVALLLAGVAAVVQSAFTSSVRNPGNTFQAGSIQLTGSVPSGSAMFSLTGMKPGTPVSRCIKVSYASTSGLTSSVRMWGVTSGALAPHLKMKVTRGVFTGAQPAGTACTGFTASPANAVFDGLMSGFPTSWQNGLADFNPAWTDGDSTIYKIDVEVADADAAQGASATHELVVEARTT